MAYTPTDWHCGDVIDDVKMNNIEQGITTLDEQVTNLTEQIDNFDLGYSCTEERTTLIEKTVTTASVQSYPEYVGSVGRLSSEATEQLYVTLDGTEYEVYADIVTVSGQEAWIYGGSIDFTNLTVDYSEFPFALAYSPSNYGTTIFTETSGSHTVKIEGVDKQIDYSDCFEAAVEDIVSSGGSTEPFIVTLDENLADTDCSQGIQSTTDATLQQITDAYMSGRQIYFVEPNGTFHNVIAVDSGHVGIMHEIYLASEQRNVAYIAWFKRASDTMAYPDCSI